MNISLIRAHLPDKDFYLMQDRAGKNAYVYYATGRATAIGELSWTITGALLEDEVAAVEFFNQIKLEALFA